MTKSPVYGRNRKKGKMDGGGPEVKEKPEHELYIGDAKSSFNPFIFVSVTKMVDLICAPGSAFLPMELQQQAASGEWVSLPTAIWNHLFPEGPLYFRSVDNLFSFCELVEEEKMVVCRQKSFLTY